MRSADQFHVGIVAEDFESTLADLSELFGYEWCQEIGGRVAVRLPTGVAEIELRCVYSTTSPRVEVVRSVPGTLWVPAAGSGVHHVGYWSDDLPADAADLVRRGYHAEATGLRPDGAPFWAYHRSAAGPRIELVSRALQPVLTECWATPRPARPLDA